LLRTLPQTRDWSLSYRLVGIAVFTILTAICAKITIPLEPVPFTMQTFAVLLAGMVLGKRDGALSQITYVALVAVGLPLDAFGHGSAALFGPTGGYLIGFIVAAYVTGWLVEGAEKRLWQRWLAGIVGAAIIHLFGVPVLSLTRTFDLGAAWALGTAPFIIPDIAKALLAASLTEGGRALLQRGRQS
jgi:biotin transport system substrate-specific component